MVLYVDDLLIIGSHSTQVLKLKKDLNYTFKMKFLGFMHQFLRVWIEQLGSGILLHQTSPTIQKPSSYYTNATSLISIFDSAFACTKKLALLQVTYIVHSYQILVGKLHYPTKTRSNTSFSTSILIRYLHNS